MREEKKAAPAAVAGPDRQALIDVIAQGLSDTWHCLRVWEAWNVGTMSQDDFEPVDESDTPAELADAILALLAAAPTTQAAPVAQGDAEDAVRLKEIARAIRDYHFALDTRQHGGVAQGKAFDAICQIMGMHWVQGDEAATRAAQKVGA